MIASTPSPFAQFATPILQNTLTADIQASEQTRVAAASLSQVAINEFALRFNAAMIEMLTAQGVSNASPLGKKLKAYAAPSVAAVEATSRFV